MALVHAAAAAGLTLIGLFVHPPVVGLLRILPPPPPAGAGGNAFSQANETVLLADSESGDVSAMSAVTVAAIGLVALTAATAIVKNCLSRRKARQNAVLRLRRKAYLKAGLEDSAGGSAKPRGMQRRGAIIAGWADDEDMDEDDESSWSSQHYADREAALRKLKHTRAELVGGGHSASDESDHELEHDPIAQRRAGKQSLESPSRVAFARSQARAALLAERASRSPDGGGYSGSDDEDPTVAGKWELLAKIESKRPRTPQKC